MNDTMADTMADTLTDTPTITDTPGTIHYEDDKPFEMKDASALDILKSQNPDHIITGKFRQANPDGSYSYCRVGWLLEHAGFDFSTIGQ